MDWERGWEAPFFGLEYNSLKAAINVIYRDPKVSKLSLSTSRSEASKPFGSDDIYKLKLAGAVQDITPSGGEIVALISRCTFHYH